MSLTDLDRLAVRVLGAVDVLRVPVRDWQSHRLPGCWWNARREYGLHGVPVRVGGADAAGRKRAERLWADLADSGLGVAVRVGVKKFAFGRLTARGEARARGVAGLPGRAEGRLFLGRVAALTRRAAKTLDRLWVDEDDLGVDAEANSLPAHAEGWVAAGTAVGGPVRYAATPAGWRELDAPSPDPGYDPPTFDPAAADLYRAARESALADLAAGDNRGEIGAPDFPFAFAGLPVGEADPPACRVRPAPGPAAPPRPRRGPGRPRKQPPG